MPEPITTTSASSAAKGGREGKRRHFWPMVASLGLAVLYWLYLNQQVSVSKSPELTVVRIKPTEAPMVGLNLRKPSADLLVSKIFKGDSKPFDPKLEKVRFDIRAPGAYMREIESLSLVVEIDPEPAEGSEDLNEYEWSFTVADVRDAKSVLTPYIVAMHPPELRLRLTRSGSRNITLDSRRLTMTYPEGKDLERRIFLDTIEFSPPTVTLRGPEDVLAELMDREKIFGLDLAKASAKISSSARSLVTGDLALLSDIAKNGVQLQEDCVARVQIAPEAEVIEGVKVPVSADWVGTPLRRNEFVVTGHVVIDIRSYNSELSRLLANADDRAAWIANDLRCHVRISEVDPSLDTQKSDFVAYLTPHFFLYDKRFGQGRDLRIQPTSLVSITRKSP